MSREEDMLTALINGDTVNITPRSRMEQYLKNCVEGCGCDGLPTPRSRAEALLYALAEKMAGGGSTGGGSTGGVNKLAQVADRTVTELTEADLQGATKIGSYAFRYCSSLTSVVIPASVKRIDEYSFTGSTSLKNIVLKPTTPPTLHYNAFNAIHADAVFTVKRGYGDTYKSATNWSDIADQIVEGDV